MVEQCSCESSLSSAGSVGSAVYGAVLPPFDDVLKQGDHILNQAMLSESSNTFNSF